MGSQKEIRLTSIKRKLRPVSTTCLSLLKLPFQRFFSLPVLKAKNLKENRKYTMYNLNA